MTCNAWMAVNPGWCLRTIDDLISLMMKSRMKGIVKLPVISAAFSAYIHTPRERRHTYKLFFLSFPSSFHTQSLLLWIYVDRLWLYVCVYIWICVCGSLNSTPPESAKPFIRSLSTWHKWQVLCMCWPLKKTKRLHIVFFFFYFINSFLLFNFF